MSTPTTVQPRSASQQVSAPSPQPRSSAWPGATGETTSARRTLTRPLQIWSRSPYRPSHCFLTSGGDIFPPFSYRQADVLGQQTVHYRRGGQRARRNSRGHLRHSRAQVTRREDSWHIGSTQRIDRDLILRYRRRFGDVHPEPLG